MFELTQTDRRRLGKMRLARLMQRVEPLRLTVCSIDDEHHLRIHCAYPKDVDDILAIEPTLKELCWVILAAHCISLWFAGECVWQVDLGEAARSALESRIIDTSEEAEMSTATAEPLAIGTIVQQVAQAEILPSLDQVIDQELEAYTASAEFQTAIQTRVKERVQSFWKSWTNASGNETETAETAAESTSESRNGSAPGFAVSANYSNTLAGALKAFSEDSKQQVAMLG